MSVTLETYQRRVAEARQNGSADDLAEALALHANALIQTGQFGSAQVDLDEAATIHRERGRLYDDARCTQMAGALCRMAGHLGEAKKRANRVLELSQSKGALAVSAYTELGEIALVEKNNVAATQAFSAALATGEDIGQVDSARAALLRKRATALTAMKQYQDAVHDLETAHELLMRSGDRATATRALIEVATALRYAGQFSDAEATVRRAMKLAEPVNDHAALADLHLLVAARALDQRDAAAALASTLAAREHALAGNAPSAYIGAAHVIAELSEAAGNRLQAYEALATGWATLGDLLGSEVARLSFEPKLRDARARWGPMAFDEIKNAYDAQRRSATREHEN
jgi:tetratricopeptide (TPR) repeat protein